MRTLPLLAFLLLIPYLHGAFYINQIDINFYVNEDGNAKAKEVYNIVIEGTVDLGKYIAHMEEKDIGGWQKLLGDEEVRIHINQLYVGVENLEVLPQPPRAPQGRGNDIITSAVLIITYDVVPKTKDGEKLFSVDRVRPRLYRYSLNTNALSLKTTALGNLLLDERTSLIFHLPKGSKIEEINPQPYEVKENYVKWRNTILVKPKLVFIREISIQEEIDSYLYSTFNTILAFFSTNEGKGVALLTLIIISFYIYLKLKMRG